MSSRIGGNIGDIVGTAGKLEGTGAAAVKSGADAAQFAHRMDGEITQVTDLLETHFNNMAESLRSEIAAAKQRLAGTDWEGTSQQAATAAEAELYSNVDQVLGNALDSTTEFKTFMKSQAQEFVSVVDGDFKTIMNNIDTAYQDLAKASKQFAQNLESADQTIKFG